MIVGKVGSWSHPEEIQGSGSTEHASPLPEAPYSGFSCQHRAAATGKGFSMPGAGRREEVCSMVPPHSILSQQLWLCTDRGSQSMDLLGEGGG